MHIIDIRIHLPFLQLFFAKQLSKLFANLVNEKEIEQQIHHIPMANHSNSFNDLTYDPNFV